jgi:hypothetical protein
MQTQLERTVAKSEHIRIPFSLGVFEDCTLHLHKNANFEWVAAIEYPEKISIRNEYPYIIPPETLENRAGIARFLFYPGSDMVGGVYEGEPTAVLMVTVSESPNDTVTLQLNLQERLCWVSDPL